MIMGIAIRRSPQKKKNKKIRNDAMRSARIDPDQHRQAAQQRQAAVLLLDDSS
jgi:hypothetical protein